MALRVSGMVSGLDTDAIVQELVSAYSTKRDNYTKSQTKLEWKMDAWKDMNSKIYSLYAGKLSNMRFSSAYNLKKTSVSEDGYVTVSSKGGVNGNQTLKVNKIAAGGYLTGATLSGKDGETVTAKTSLSDLGIEEGSKIKVNGTEIEIAEDETMSSFVGKLKEAGVSVNFDEKNQRLFVNSTSSGLDGEFTLTAANEEGYEALKSLGMFAVKDVNGGDTAEVEYYRNVIKQYENQETEISDEEYNIAKQIIEGIENGTIGNEGDVARISGMDAEIELNGATYKSSTGTFSINGLSITANKETNGKVLTLSTTNDSQGIYDMIKDFFKEYNELIKSMDTAYNAESSGDYEPLTDDEMAEMSEKQIEKWETKIKDALLRRDSTLGTVANSMKSIMQTSFEINGKKMSLSSLGINTLGYFSSEDNEKGVFHIDGDSEDSDTKGNEDKLMAAINEDPEAVAEFFQKLSSKLYSDLGKKMASSSTSSAFTIYNDKEMSSEYSRFSKQISSWNEKLDYYEEFYYQKFSRMETALAKLQSSTNSLASLFGTN